MPVNTTLDVRFMPRPAGAGSGTCRAEVRNGKAAEDEARAAAHRRSAEAREQSSVPPGDNHVLRAGQLAPKIGNEAIDGPGKAAKGP